MNVRIRLREKNDLRRCLKMASNGVVVKSYERQKPAYTTTVVIQGLCLAWCAYCVLYVMDKDPLYKIHSRLTTQYISPVSLLLYNKLVFGLTRKFCQKF